MPDDRVALYRIVHERFAGAPFSGEGGLLYASRWASKRQRVSYAADHLALAALEKIAGVQRVDLLSEMVYVKAEIASDHVAVLPEKELPDDWNALPPKEATRVAGEAWLRKRRRPLLRVPSAILPHSYNFVIDATHPEIGALGVVETRPLLLDNRVLRQLGVTSS